MYSLRPLEYACLREMNTLLTFPHDFSVGLAVDACLALANP